MVPSVAQGASSFPLSKFDILVSRDYLVQKENNFHTIIEWARDKRRSINEARILMRSNVTIQFRPSKEEEIARGEILWFPQIVLNISIITSSLGVYFGKFDAQKCDFYRALWSQKIPEYTYTRTYAHTHACMHTYLLSWTTWLIAEHGLSAQWALPCDRKALIELGPDRPSPKRRHPEEGSCGGSRNSD